MRAHLLEQTLKGLINIGRSVAIEGPPGGGKTSIVYQVGRSMQLPVITNHMPTMLVEDFGIPFPSADQTSFGYKMPDWYPYQGKPGTENGGILLFDDRNQANADLQKVLANILQERTLHGVPLADNWSVVSTGNRQSDRAGANRVLSHLRNRETVVELDTHLDDSTAWMIANNTNPMVVAFLRFRPNLLHDFDPQRDTNPTPRSWVEGVSAVLGHVPSETEFECIKGAVGEGAAAEFVGFVKIYRALPDPDSILANPHSGSVPTDPATLYALAGALADRVTPTSMDNLVTYLDRLPPEFGVLCVSYALRKTPNIAQTKGFADWAINNKSVLF